MKQTLWLVFFTCWGALMNGQTVTWNDNDGSVAVVGEEVFIYKTSYNNALDLQYDFKEISSLINTRTTQKYGLIVNGIVNPQKITTKSSEFPDADGVTLSVYFYDFNTNEPINAPIYSTFATENSTSYQENELIFSPHRRNLQGLKETNSTKIRGRTLSFLSSLVTMENNIDHIIFTQPSIPQANKIKGYSLSNKYAVYIKVKVRNATLYRMNIPGVGKITPKKLFNDNPDKNVNLLKQILNDPKNYNYSFVSAHRGYWAEPEVAENTIKAFERAFEIGADLIEIDVRLTNDNIPVACHDEFLYRQYDISNDLAVKYNKTINTLTIGDISVADFKGLKTKNRFGTILNNYPNTIDEILKKFPHHLISLDPKDVDIKANPESNIVANPRWSECFKKCLELGKTNNILSNLILKGKPKMKYNDAEKLVIEAGVNFKDFIFTPMMYAFTNKIEPDIKDLNNRYQGWINKMKDKNIGIRVAEVHFKYNSDRLLSRGFPKLLHDNNLRVAIYSFSADCPTGIYLMEKNGETRIREYTPNINYSDDDGTLPLESMIDNRGNIDWCIEKGGVNYIVHDRPDIAIKLLKAYGMRSVIKKPPVTP